MGAFTDRVSRSAKREKDRLGAEFPREEPCHDCAFRPDSPERDDPEEWARILRQTDPAIGVPFYCHFAHDGTEMPTNAKGEYTPRRRADGRPIGYPICAGWTKTFDVKLERLRKQGAG